MWFRLTTINLASQFETTVLVLLIILSIRMIHRGQWRCDGRLYIVLMKGWYRLSLIYWYLPFLGLIPIICINRNISIKIIIAAHKCDYFIWNNELWCSNYWDLNMVNFFKISCNNSKSCFVGDVLRWDRPQSAVNTDSRSCKRQITFTSIVKSVFNLINTFIVRDLVSYS